MRGKLMRLFTKEQHQSILTKYPKNGEARRAYMRISGQACTPHNVAYWRKIFVDNDGNLAKTDRQLKQTRRIRVPDADDDIGILPDFNKVYTCVLAIPDQHAPYNHPDMVPFLAEVKRRFPIDLVVNLGDELDMHAMSFHDSDPNLDSAGPELERGKVIMQELYELFPNQLVCSSNHGSMAYRKAKHGGLPVQFLRRYRDVIFPAHGAPGWSWAFDWKILTPMGEVMFKHQSNGILNDAAHNRCNLMVGHSHGNFSTEYCASADYLYWGAFGGCLIDNKSYAFAYGKQSKNKPIVGCTLIMNGMPMQIPMILNADGRWVGKLAGF